MPTKRGRKLQAKAMLKRLQKKHRRFNKLAKDGKRRLVQTDVEGNLLQPHQPPAPLPDALTQKAS